MKTKLKNNYDCLIIGGGAAGLAAALSCHQNNLQNTLLIEREPELGGILQQCIHAGFGLHYFKEELTGPEYAEKFIQQLKQSEIPYLCNAFVYNITLNNDQSKTIQLISQEHGIKKITAKAIILTTGSRERTRAAIKIPGSRPTGVLSAGLAQKLINMKGLRPGTRAVILGSGDIGLIMARRLSLENIDVIGVFELMPYSNGLKRNIVQCLDDFNIPLHLSTTVTNIIGNDRLEAIEIAPVDENLNPIPEKKQKIPCDTLLLSVGLIPDISLLTKLEPRTNPTTSTAFIDSNYQTSIPGVFAAGNALHIHDLVDFVSRESSYAATCAAYYIHQKTPNEPNIELIPSKNIKYCIPNTITKTKSHIISMRTTTVMEKCTITIPGIFTKKLPFAMPSEMITFTLPQKNIENLNVSKLHIQLIPDHNT